MSRIWKKKWINIGPVNLHPDLSGRPDISFRVWNFEKYKVASIFFSFFKVWTMFFLLTVWNLKEKRPGCLFSFWITKKSWSYFFAPHILHYIFTTQFFSGPQINPVFKAKREEARLPLLFLNFVTCFFQVHNLMQIDWANA